MTEIKTMLVIGATGVIGRRTIQHLDAAQGWRAIGVSRRKPDYPTEAAHVSADLMDKDDCKAKLGALDGVTHLLYAAYSDRPTWAAQCAPNALMLENVLDGIEAGGAKLERIVLMQGTKYYGSHLGPFKTPALESDPRHMPPNFYFNQQDLLMERQARRPWRWTCLRPHTVCGFAVGMPMNLVAVIGVYAAISKELGLPLRFPGTEACYRAVFQVTDADLLARATLWAAGHAGLRRRGLQHHQRRLLPLAASLAALRYASSAWTTRRRRRSASPSSWPTRSRCGARWCGNTS